MLEWLAKNQKQNTSEMLYKQPPVKQISNELTGRLQLSAHW